MVRFADTPARGLVNATRLAAAAVLPSIAGWPAG